MVAKNGYAEVLKAMNRLPEALAAYDEARREHPESVVAKNGQACVLAALRRYGEALEALPELETGNITDWVGYHIRGMIYLRMGHFDEAVPIFRRGRAESPVQQVDYFRTSLTVALLRQQEWGEAEEMLAQVHAPELSGPRDILRIHLLGAQGYTEQAIQVYDAVLDMPGPKPEPLLDEYKWQFIEGHEPRYDATWMMNQQIDYCFLAAA